MSGRSEGRRRRAARAERKPGSIAQRPFKQIEYLYQPQQILSADHVQAIHQTALKILANVGMKVLSERARTAYAEAGFDVGAANEMVKFDAAGIEALIARAPSSFTLHARNAARNVKVGGRHAIFSSVGGPA